MASIKAFKDIELDLVLEKVRSFSLFKESEDYINFKSFTADKDVINDRYLKIERYMNLLESANDLNSFPSIFHIFSYARKSHQDIEGKDVFLIGLFLESYEKMLVFLDDGETLSEEDGKLKEEIIFSLDQDGNVNENHPRLLVHKKALDAAKSRRSSYTASFMRDNRNILQGENPLFKDNRIVLPIKASERSKVKGYLQGSSQSGQTLFLESLDLINLNNDVLLAEERIKEEERKIKHELSEKVRAVLDEIYVMRKRAMDFDFHYAFSVWAKKNNARHVRNANNVDLINARHPLLKKAVPINIKINENIKTVVFSGANAGGKTVTMKTIALLSALNQISGFTLADEVSTLPYFDNILTDIGDNQSILSDESTFSAHLKNISYCIKNTTENSLILLDELGSGTDPEEGAALALSILDYLSPRARLTLTSSHYSKVKNHAYTKEDMMNASMAFSDSTGLPLFKVIENIPGDSHAIDAAVRAHLPKEIIESARSVLSDRNESAASLISSLIKKSRTLDRKMTEAELERRYAQKEKDDLEERLREIEKEKRELEKEGLKEISSFLKDSRRTLETLIKDITTGKLDKNKIKKAKDFMEYVQKKEESVKKSVEEKEETDEPLKEFDVGENVLCGGSRVKGQILEKNKKSYTVILDSGLKLTLSAKDIYKREGEKKVTIEKAISAVNKKAEYEMDLRGLRGDEAIEKIEDQIEACTLTGLSSFSIIHGLGDGRLMKRIHEYLKTNNNVKNYYFARPEDGGMGKTYVDLM